MAYKPSENYFISRSQLMTIRDALTAPTHEANGYNCQDWPPGQGCCGCDGDERREQAVALIDELIHNVRCIQAKVATEADGSYDNHR